MVVGHGIWEHKWHRLLKFATLPVRACPKQGSTGPEPRRLKEMQILWFQKLRYGKTHPAESETCATGCNFARDHAGIEHGDAPKSSPVASEPA